MHEYNQHTYRPVLIGEILKDGQFKIISRTKGTWSRSRGQVHEPGQGLRLGQAPGYVSEEGLSEVDCSCSLVVAWLAGPPAGHAQRPPRPSRRSPISPSTMRTSARRPIAVIGGTRDPKWLEFLAALRDGNVYARGKSKDARS